MASALSWHVEAHARSPSITLWARAWVASRCLAGLSAQMETRVLCGTPAARASARVEHGAARAGLRCVGLSATQGVELTGS